TPRLQSVRCDPIRYLSCRRDRCPWLTAREAPARRQQQRALQNKPIREWGLRKAIEESLHSEVLEQFLERTSLRTGLVEQSLPDRGALVATAHSMASRYGRITSWTRFIRANLASA